MVSLVVYRIEASLDRGIGGILLSSHAGRTWTAPGRTLGVPCSCLAVWAGIHSRSPPTSSDERVFLEPTDLERIPHGPHDDSGEEF